MSMAGAFRAWFDPIVSCVALPAAWAEYYFTYIASMRFALGAALIASANCGLWPTGPSRSVAGSWYSPGGRANSFQLSITQDGDTISGFACNTDAGFLLFRDAPVRGDYPKVSFTAPSGATFSGRFEDDRDQIAGDYKYGSSHKALRFARSDSGGRCANLIQFPRP